MITITSSVRASSLHFSSKTSVPEVTTYFNSTWNSFPAAINTMKTAPVSMTCDFLTDLAIKWSIIVHTENYSLYCFSRDVRSEKRRSCMKK